MAIGKDSLNRAASAAGKKKTTAVNEQTAAKDTGTKESTTKTVTPKKSAPKKTATARKTTVKKAVVANPSAEILVDNKRVAIGDEMPIYFY